MARHADTSCAMSSGRLANTSQVLAKRVTSPHILALIHSSSLGWGTDLASVPTPPVRKKLNSSIGNRPSLVMILVQSKNEKSSLSFSNSDRHTFWYSEYVKWLAMIFRRSPRSTSLVSSPCSSAGSSSSSSSADAWMDRTNRPMNQDSEYWYIGSMLARSRMVKNNTELYAPHGLYPSRAASISIWVASATTCFSVISSETILASLRVSIPAVSSRMFPSEEERVWRMRSSMSLRRFLLSADSTTSFCRCASRSGRSSATTTPRS
mmetsp:Transcript_6920/g.18891  ORF Transcript_6920/g.18891 Transcript_6920/m.18891 type:complete len:265 (+) Transcript_6920:2119-2913(+)